MSVITSAKQQFVTRLRTEVRDTLHVDHLLKLSSGLDRRVDGLHLEVHEQVEKWSSRATSGS